MGLVFYYVNIGDLEKAGGVLDALQGLAQSKNDLITPYQDWIASLLRDEEMEAKQVWRLFQEKKGEKGHRGRDALKNLDSTLAPVLAGSLCRTSHMY